MVTSNITLKDFLNQVSEDKLVTLKGLILSGGLTGKLCRFGKRFEFCYLSSRRA